MKTIDSGQTHSTEPLILGAGIIDIGIEYCGTVCSQHHTVWEDPLSLRGAKLLFVMIQREICAVG